MSRRFLVCALAAAFFALAALSCQSKDDAPVGTEDVSESLPPLPKADLLYECTVCATKGAENAEEKGYSTVSLKDACTLATRTACHNASTNLEEAAACANKLKGWELSVVSREARVRQ